MKQQRELGSLHHQGQERQNFRNVAKVKNGVLGNFFNVLIRREGRIKHNTKILGCQTLRSHIVD